MISENKLRASIDEFFDNLRTSGENTSEIYKRKEKVQNILEDRDNELGFVLLGDEEDFSDSDYYVFLNSIKDKLGPDIYYSLTKDGDINAVLPLDYNVALNMFLKRTNIRK